MSKYLLRLTTLGEFSKLEIENQVRIVVAHLMDPIIDKNNTNTNDIKEIRRSVESLHKTVDDMDRVLKNELNLKSFLTELKKRQKLLVSISYLQQP